MRRIIPVADRKINQHELSWKFESRRGEGSESKRVLTFAIVYTTSQCLLVFSRDEANKYLLLTLVNATQRVGVAFRLSKKTDTVWVQICRRDRGQPSILAMRSTAPSDAEQRDRVQRGRVSSRSNQQR
jgi:hypothetical protein